MPDPTIWDLEPHTEAKHRIYDGYLDAWFPIILRQFGTATYAEGFAGPGVYTDGEPGSPIRALRRLRNAQDRDASLASARVRFVLVDYRQDRINCLIDQFEHELGAALPEGRFDDGLLSVVIRCGTCEHDLPAALTEAGVWQQPILAVLDSFGGGCTQDLLRWFAQNRASEVLTTVDVQYFVRELDPDRADQVFGDNEWRQVADLSAERKRAFVAARLDAAARGAGFPHVVRFGLHTTTGGELMLQFGTRHPRGLEKFKDSAWRADPVAGAGFRDPDDPDQLLLPMSVEPDLAPLRRILHQLLCCRPQHTATIGKLRSYTLAHTIFKESHAIPAIEAMRAAGQITTEPHRAEIRPRTPRTTLVRARVTEPTLFD